MHTFYKISQAKAKLLVDYPYFGTLASKLELVLNDDIQAFKSDGKKLEYSLDFLQNAELSELEFVLANGAMHSVLAHESRKNNRSGWLWQMATDIAINDMLIENGLDMPQDAQYRARFKGMYAEEIYAELKDDILREDEGLEYDADDSDDVEQNSDEKQENKDEIQTKEELQEEIFQEQLLAEEAISLLASEFKKGEIPHAMDRFFKLDFMGKINWREELKSAIDRFHKDDYTLLPPNKKFLHMGIYLPSNVSQTFRLVIAVDSSGSVDEVLLNQFLSEVNFLMSLIQNYKIELIVCDEMIQSHDTFYSGDTLACGSASDGCGIKGGMGTDFRPVFEFIDKEFDDVKLLLYFTDLDGKFPHVPERSDKYSWGAVPSYEVKWISQKAKEIPFGEIIILDY